MPSPMMLTSFLSVLPDSQPDRVHLSSLLSLLATFHKRVHYRVDSCHVVVVKILSREVLLVLLDFIKVILGNHYGAGVS